MASDSPPCSAQQNFIADITEGLLGSNSDVRLALIRHEDTPTVVFNFDQSISIDLSLLVDEFLRNMPCSLMENNDVDPYETLIEAVSLFDMQSEDGRLKKILMINNCEATVDTDDLCPAFPNIFDAFNIELILVNADAGFGLDLDSYVCLVDDGQLNEEWFPFAQITTEILSTADDSVIDQLCSQDDPPPPNPVYVKIYKIYLRVLCRLVLLIIDCWEQSAQSSRNY